MELFSQHYMVADKPGDIHYEVDPADEQAQILAVRNAKEVGDFVDLPHARASKPPRLSALLTWTTIRLTTCGHSSTS